MCVCVYAGKHMLWCPHGDQRALLGISSVLPPTQVVSLNWQGLLPTDAPC